MSADHESRSRQVTAVLGPTNTGKTHLAIERMLGHASGMIGLPLRLLAREVYDRIVARIGPNHVALITGEEKIKPEFARYWVCTVEAMPSDIQTDFLAIDEIQLCADPERGHVFTDRLLHARGREETLMLGAGTMRDAIADLIEGANFVTRPRLSKLTYAGEKKITRLPPRSAVVTFSANDVYAIADLIRRQRGGAAVVIGALSPRTRNAQVAMYQAGEVDYLVATDAIGMGLNLDLDHVALAQTRKFDGVTHRELTPAEIAQIAGRAGRHTRDGTFGVTGGIDALAPDLVERLENHQFEPIRMLQWRMRALDFTSVHALRESLRLPPREVRLQRARMADDVMALESVAQDRELVELANTSKRNVELLWDVCQVPDYRKISSQNHAELIATLFKALTTGQRKISEDWIKLQVEVCARTDGDIDTLSNRLAHIRTWTYIANHPDWLQHAEQWQARTREIEDQLSDALHEQLTQRFVDKRTSALVKGMRDKDELATEIGEDGSVHVEQHFVGRLRGFTFKPETQAEDLQGKASRAAANHVLAKELGMRARRVSAAKSDAFKLARNGDILWRSDPIARLAKGDAPLAPKVVLIVDEQLAAADREKVQTRMDQWVTEQIGDKLKPLVDVSKAEDLTGLGKGIGFRLTETFGVLKREMAADELKSLDQSARAALRRYGVRFGAFNVFFPVLLKPAAAEWALVLAVLNGVVPAMTLDAMPEAPKAGLTSLPHDPNRSEAYYRTMGFHVCGSRAVRLDMLERLADLIRPLLAYRADQAKPGSRVPIGATGDGGFIVTPAMMSILGCSQAELAHVLGALGFRSERKLARLAIKSPPPAPVSAPVADENASTAATPVDPAPDAPAALDAADDAALDSLAADETLPAPATTPESAVEPAAPPAIVEPAVAAAVTDQHATAAGELSATAPEPPVAAGDAAAAAEAGTAAAPAEEPMVDVWRPKRRHQHHGRGQGQQRREGDGPRQGGKGRWQGKPGQNGPRKPTPKPVLLADGTPAPIQPADAPFTPPPGLGPSAAAGTEAATRADQGDRRAANREARDERSDERGPRRDGKAGGDRAKWDRPQQGRGGDRGDRRGGDRERGGGGRPPQQFSAAPAKTARGPDPDSPFAKLMALKAALEKPKT
jgi:ATP-dependent RNA helicase SUPV3L1/SUV3